MADDVLRTFFAVDLGAAARREAEAVAARLAAEPGGERVRWSRPEAYHVTLRFLGPTQRRRVADVAAAVRDAVRDVPRFTLALGPLHAFPTPRRPRVIVLDLTPAAAIGALAAQVEAAAVASGFAPEPRAFHPHVTLGRVKEGAARRVPPAGGLAWLDARLGPADPAPFRVEEIVFYESVLSSQGSHYTPLQRIPLGGAVS